MKLFIFADADFEKQYGSTQRSFKLSKNLSKRGFEVYLTVKGREKHGIVKYSKNLFLVSFSSRLKFVCSLGQLIKRCNFDVIYACGAINFLLTIFILKLLRVPFGGDLVLDLDSSDFHQRMMYVGYFQLQYLPLSFFSWIQEKLALFYADAVIFASYGLKDFCSSYFGKVRVPNTIVENGFDEERFYVIKNINKKISRRKLGFSPSEKLIVFPAPRIFFSNVMAIRFLYKVANLVYRQEGKAVRFVILGGGGIVPGKPPNVTYTGHVKDINYWLNIADVAVAPYGRKAVCGGARNKILEYMAVGLPIVSTQEGMRYIRAKGGKHFVPAGYTPVQFAKSLSSVLANRDSARELGKNARRLVCKEYTWEKQSRKLACFLKSFKQHSSLYKGT